MADTVFSQATCRGRNCCGPTDHAAHSCLGEYHLHSPSHQVLAVPSRAPQTHWACPHRGTAHPLRAEQMPHSKLANSLCTTDNSGVGL